MSMSRLVILHNEAKRQRALDAIHYGIAFAGDEKGTLNSLLRVHGPYTEGFYRGQRDALRKKFE